MSFVPFMLFLFRFQESQPTSGTKPRRDPAQDNRQSPRRDPGTTDQPLR